MRTTWLAYNRRADVILEPEGEKSEEAYPNDVADARILWERRVPNLKAVMAASTTPVRHGTNSCERLRQLSRIEEFFVG